MEIDWLIWCIAFLFFLPLHFGVPLLYSLIQQGPEEMRKKIPGLLLWGGLSAIVGFTAALLLWPHSKTWAAIAIVIALILPWIDLIFKRKS